MKGHCDVSKMEVLGKHMLIQAGSFKPAFSLRKTEYRVAFFTYALLFIHSSIPILGCGTVKIFPHGYPYGRPKFQIKPGFCKQFISDDHHGSCPTTFRTDGIPILSEKRLLEEKATVTYTHTQG